MNHINTKFSLTYRYFLGISLAHHLYTVLTVTVTGMNSNTVAIMGGVGRSGTLPLQQETRVLQAIAISGGFSTWAKTDKVRILRQTPQGLVEYRFDYKAYLAGKAPESNLVLRAGDTIVVPD